MAGSSRLVVAGADLAQGRGALVAELHVPASVFARFLTTVKNS